ncbi:MAG: hypothetical protein JXA42_20715, partial [Anaerolineales bacterium]|nr:hypothetical protein [Anaerolineales bacterium]
MTDTLPAQGKLLKRESLFETNTSRTYDSRQYDLLATMPGSCEEKQNGVFACYGSQERAIAADSPPPLFQPTLRGISSNLPQPEETRTALSIVTVDTTDMTSDGDVSSVAALLADPGEDGSISFLEALTAVNNTGSGHSIHFDLPPDAAITFGYTLYLMAPNTTIEGDRDSDGEPDVMLDGPDGYISLEIKSDNNQIRSLAITGLNINGSTAHSNLVYNCHIGTDLAGTGARSENVNGLQLINGAHSNTIDTNLIAGNTFSNPDKGASGLILGLGAHDNVITNNRIGITWGDNTLGNEFGIVLYGGSYKNKIGGDRSDPECADPCNLISGNSVTGVEIDGKGTKENEILGNFIGVDSSGMTAKPNGLEGIKISNGAAQNLVGGSRVSTVECRGPCNLLSGNATNGALITGRWTDYNQVKGNYIGVKIDNSGALPNGGTGVLIEDHAMLNTIGGKQPTDSECSGPCNLISGNTLAGVGILGPDCGGNKIQGNFIGIDKDGSPVASLGNKSVGIGIIDASDNQIGGGDSGEGNRIVDNAMEGIYIAKTKDSTDATNHNLIRRNTIYSNGGMAIDLSPDDGVGVDGPNDNRLPPVIYPVRSTQTRNTIYGTSTVSDGSVVDLYEDGGTNYLGSTTINGGVFELNVTGSGPLANPVVGTVSDTDNNTSEFSAYGELTLSSPYVLPGGKIYAFGIITQTQDLQPLLYSEDVTITFGSEAYPLRGDGKEEDFFKDSYYSAWITAPLTLGDYEVVLTINETPAAVTTFHVTDQPQMVILTDLQELKNEFVRTSTRADVLKIYPALKRLSEYAGKYNGVFIDLRQEVKSTSSTDSRPYKNYFYTAGGVWHREFMVLAIDNYIHSLEQYKNTL